jgi:hypothetical protein
VFSCQDGKCPNRREDGNRMFRDLIETAATTRTS